MLRANPRHQPLTKSGLDVGPLRVGSFASWRRANPAPVGCSLSHLGLDDRQVPLLLREPGSSAGRPAPEPRSGVRRVPPSGLDRKPSSPLEARVSPEFRAAMSVGEIKVTPNRFSGKRPVWRGCDRSGEGLWKTVTLAVDGFEKPSQCKAVSFPQIWGPAAGNGSSRRRARRPSSGKLRKCKAKWSARERRLHLLDAQPVGFGGFEAGACGVQG